jgi:hypothetical protein
MTRKEVNLGEKKEEKKREREREHIIQQMTQAADSGAGFREFTRCAPVVSTSTHAHVCVSQQVSMSTKASTCT